uniref:Uncharacterized protein n=1 Tax=Corethron hystrix TaxID=216773 RepID=A0A7S1BPK4_9STRA|mmetsp:Transcript_3451/g.6384  ORF Transcript_3451/g.6384 Transcript_3451/m.6384 type:complete len:156 (+) Transcript_3451:1401-1868(+)
MPYHIQLNRFDNAFRRNLVWSPHLVWGKKIKKAQIISRKIPRSITEKDANNLEEDIRRVIEESAEDVSFFRSGTVNAIHHRLPGRHALLFNAADEGFEHEVEGVVFNTTVEFQGNWYSVWAFRKGKFVNKGGSEDWAYKGPKMVRVRRIPLREII